MTTSDVCLVLSAGALAVSLLALWLNMRVCARMCDTISEQLRAYDAPREDATGVAGDVPRLTEGRDGLRRRGEDPEGF